MWPEFGTSVQRVLLPMSPSPAVWWLFGRWNASERVSKLCSRNSAQCGWGTTHRCCSQVLQKVWENRMSVWSVFTWRPKPTSFPWPDVYPGSRLHPTSLLFSSSLTGLKVEPLSFFLPFLFSASFPSLRHGVNSYITVFSFLMLIVRSARLSSVSNEVRSAFSSGLLSFLIFSLNFYLCHCHKLREGFVSFCKRSASLLTLRRNNLWRVFNLSSRRFPGCLASWFSCGVSVWG